MATNMESALILSNQFNRLNSSLPIKVTLNESIDSYVKRNNETNSFPAATLKTTSSLLISSSNKPNTNKLLYKRSNFNNSFNVDNSNKKTIAKLDQSQQQLNRLKENKVRNESLQYILKLTQQKEHFLEINNMNQNQSQLHHQQKQKSNDIIAFDRKNLINLKRTNAAINFWYYKDDILNEKNLGDDLKQSMYATTITLQSSSYLPSLKKSATNQAGRLKELSSRPQSKLSVSFKTPMSSSSSSSSSLNIFSMSSSRTEIGPQNQLTSSNIRHHKLTNNNEKKEDISNEQQTIKINKESKLSFKNEKNNSVNLTINSNEQGSLYSTQASLSTKSILKTTKSNSISSKNSSKSYTTEGQSIIKLIDMNAPRVASKVTLSKMYENDDNNNNNNNNNSANKELNISTTSLVADLNTIELCTDAASSRNVNKIIKKEKRRMFLSSAELRKLSISDKFIKEAKNMFFVPKTKSFYPKSYIWLASKHYTKQN